MYESKSGKEQTMDQEFEICSKVYEIGTYSMRRVCVALKKYSLKKPSYIQVRLFTAKENQDLKQVAYVNLTIAQTLHNDGA